MRWQVVLAAIVCGVVLALAIRVHTMGSTVQEMETMMHEKIMVEYDTTDAAGVRHHWYFEARPGETFEHLVARAEGVVFRGDRTSSGDFCWESDCTTSGGQPYHVKFCLPSQEALDAAVASYCASHDCEACQ